VFVGFPDCPPDASEDCQREQYTDENITVAGFDRQPQANWWEQADQTCAAASGAFLNKSVDHTWPQPKDGENNVDNNCALLVSSKAEIYWG
jgi:hypothetical protein